MWRLQVLNKCQLILHTWPEEGARAVFWHWFGIKIVLGLLVDIVMSQNYIHIWWRVIKYECEEVRVLNPWKLAKGEKKKKIPSPINLTALALESVDVWEFWHLPVFVTELVAKSICSRSGLVRNECLSYICFIQENFLWENKDERLPSWKVIPTYSWWRCK